MDKPTRSELLFEQFMSGQGIQPVRIKETTKQEPDYLVKFGEETVFFEVKEFQGPRSLPSGGSDPLPYVRRKIQKARKKFDQYLERPCCLVLYNNQSIAVALDPYSVLCALFGEYFQREPGPALLISGSAELHADKNTTVSAVITLRPLRLDPITIKVGEARYERERTLGRRLSDDEVRAISNNVLEYGGAAEEGTIIRATVFKNPYARRPLPSDLFRGPFDEWWERQDEYFRCTFRGRRLSKLWDVLPDYARAPISGMY